MELKKLVLNRGRSFSLCDVCVIDTGNLWKAAMMAFQSFKLCTSQRADLDLCINKCAWWASNAFKATSVSRERVFSCFITIKGEKREQFSIVEPTLSETEYFILRRLNFKMSMYK